MKKISFGIATFIVMLSCNKQDDMTNGGGETEFKQKMRDFVIELSQYSKSIAPSFIIIPQNGIELVSTTGDAMGQPHTAYLDAIDANGQEDLNFGYDDDDIATPSSQSNYLTELLNISKQSDNPILVTDYCWTNTHVAKSYAQNINNGYVPFVATDRELNSIPAVPNPIHQENNSDITDVRQVKNFLYLINPSNFPTKSAFIAAVTATNYDLLIMDLYFNEQETFTASEISQLKSKANGGKRLVISYMSIGEAESYRYYWQANWKANKPIWLDAENPNWAGNYKVKYWSNEWKDIIYGNDNSYLKKILNAKFDGVYLDIIDAFEYYEN